MRNCSFHLFLIALIVVFSALWATTSVCAPVPSSESLHNKEFQPGELLLEDSPQALPRNPSLSEANRDKVEALTLFAAARSLELHEQYADALRLYQRAFRFDPQSADINRSIVSLAIHLKRENIAIRYTLKAVELDEEFDPMLLRRLGVRLEEEGEWTKAVKLLQKAIALRSGHDPDSSDDIILRLDAGRLWMLVGKYKEAADCFIVVVHALDHPDKYGLSEEMQKALMENIAQSYTLFGDCFLLADRIDAAKDAYEKSQKAEANELLWKFHQAQVEAKSGHNQEALAALDEVISKRPTSLGMKPYELLADILKNLKQENDLIPRLQKIYEDDKQNVSLAYFLAEKYLEAGKLDEAESLFTELINKGPTQTAYKSLLEIYRKTKKLDKLLNILAETVEKTGVLDTLGTEAMSLSKDQEMMQGLIDIARKERTDNPNDKSIYGKSFALGMLALDAKQWETAGEFFTAAITAQPKQAAEVYLVWGIGLMVDNKSAEAIKVFQKGIDDKALPENNPIFHFYLAGALAVEGKTEEALSAAQKAADMKKSSARFRSRIGWVYYHAKRYSDAEREYKQVINDFDDEFSNPENRESLKEVRLALSNICVLQNKMPEAAEWLEQVLDEFPDDVGAMNDLGYLWADENKHLDRALTMIRKAVDAEPENGAFRDSLGWALYRLGRYDESIAELEKAVQKQPDGVVLDHLGDAFLKANKPEKATDAWHRAVDLLRREKDDAKARQIENKINSIGQNGQTDKSQM